MCKRWSRSRDSSSHGRGGCQEPSQDSTRLVRRGSLGEMVVGVCVATINGVGADTVSLLQGSRVYSVQAPQTLSASYQNTCVGQASRIDHSVPLMSTKIVNSS